MNTDSDYDVENESKYNSDNERMDDVPDSPQ